MDWKLLTAIIIDDERDSIEVLDRFINLFFPDVKVLGTACSVQQGKALIKELRPRLVFLDIQMKDGTGFDLLDRFSLPEFHVIFTTAYDQFALKAFRYNAIDYLLKPINPDRLVNALKKISNLGKDGKLSKPIQDRLEVNCGNKIYWVPIHEILFIQADTCYTYINLRSGEKLAVSKTMKRIEEALPKAVFARIHHSYIVNILLVKYFLKDEGGYAVLENGKKLPVSRRKKEAFLHHLKQ